MRLVESVLGKSLYSFNGVSFTQGISKVTTGYGSRAKSRCVWLKLSTSIKSAQLGNINFVLFEIRSITFRITYADKGNIRETFRSVSLRNFIASWL